jgi:hypothetical protein
MISVNIFDVVSRGNHRRSQQQHSKGSIVNIAQAYIGHIVNIAQTHISYIVNITQPHIGYIVNIT